MNTTVNAKFNLFNSDGGGFSADGRLSLTGGGFEAEFKIENDDCRVRFENRRLCYERKGAVRLDMVFIKGEETECKVGGGEAKGSFFIFTKKLFVLVEDKKVFAETLYTLNDKKMKLKFEALF